MVEQLALAVGAVSLIALAALATRRTGAPSPVLLVIAGLVYALLPGPNVSLDPEVVLVLIIPAVLYSAALEASLLDIRANARPIGFLSVGLVLFTALAVGVVAVAAVPGLPLAAGIALGAVLAPPDAVAAIAIGRRSALPPRLLTIIEGEGLINDGTALTVLLVAVEAVGGEFSLPSAVGQFLLSAGGGAAIGWGVAWLVQRLRARLDDPLIENTLSLATPFLAFLPAEELHVSGVLAVVVCGLVVGHHSSALLSSASRLQTRAVWRLIDFLLEGVVFLLIGQQLPVVLAGLEGYSSATIVGSSALVLAAVVLVRPLWVFPATYLPRVLSARLRARDPSPPWQLTAVLSWAGTRGVISLAGAFSLPETFPQRDLLVFLTFVVVLATLVVQGVTLGPLVRLLGVRSNRQGPLAQQAAARHAAVSAGLVRLDELVAGQPPPDGVAQRLTEQAQSRRNAGWERLGAQPGAGESVEMPSVAFARLRRGMIAAERQELLRWRDAGRLDDSGLRTIELELDLEEGLLP